MSAVGEPVVVALGSNLDAPEQQVRAAFARLGAIPETGAWRLSPVFRTPPWGFAGQPDFANAVALGACRCAPLVLMQALQAIEKDLGRVRDGIRNGPRRIDLDLVAFGDRRFVLPELELPHPRAHARAFVLGPWRALDPEARLPGGEPVVMALERLPESDRASLRNWSDALL